MRIDIFISLPHYWEARKAMAQDCINLTSLLCLVVNPIRETLKITSHTSVNPLSTGPICQDWICCMETLGMITQFP